MLPLKEYINILEKLGFQQLNDESDINGWQVDFWNYFKNENINICLSGNLYYGNYNLKINEN